MRSRSPARTKAKTAAKTWTTTLEPTLSAELVATLVVNAICAVLIVVHWYETRRDVRALRAEVRAGIRSLRKERRAGVRGLRQDVRSDSSHICGDLADLRRDIQDLTVRMARMEGLLLGYVAARGPLDRRDDSA